MADAAVDFRELRSSRITWIRGSENGVAVLEQELFLFKAQLQFLAAQKHINDAKVQQFLRLIRDVLYDADDMVDAFVTLNLDASKSTKNYFSKKQGMVHIDQVIEAIRSSVIDIFDRIDHFGMFSARNVDTDQEIEAPQVRKVNVVGFKDETDMLIRCLTEQTTELDVISITGIGGTGKTTLAQMVFNLPEIKNEFPIRIWVYVSPNLKRKDVFRTILRELKTVRDEDLHHESERELARLISAQLEGRKFLIVMDDISNTADLEKLKIAFPYNSNMGKILITTRHGEVARHASRNRNPVQVQLLTHEESCLLLCLEVFGKHQFPRELKILGNKIAQECNGRPLWIVVVGGILARKQLPSTGMAEMEYEWKEVSNNMSTYVNDDSWREMETIIALSYNNLSYHLRTCFLYLVMFPKGYAIPVWKLIRMWIAEGFIQPKVHNTLEETAENYLNDLINSNLVIIDKMTPDGRVKTCHIHGILWDFCKMEAGNETKNFIQEINKSGDEIQKCRRLCIYSDIRDFISSKPYGPHVRSLVCFHEDEIQLDDKVSNILLTAFKLIRVLDVKPIKFHKLSNYLFELFHLKYIHLSFNLDYLPAAFSKFCNIQTLIVDTTFSTLKIKADVWQMTHLRHFKTKASATLPMRQKYNDDGGEMLQTLGTISPKSCTKEVLEKVHNLKKLGIRGKLASFVDGKIGSIDCLVKLENLEKLKLLNDAASSKGQLRGLPPSYIFPPNLQSLTLCGTFLEWRHMSILGLLEKLKVLKLKDGAFMGQSWNAADGGFPSLEFLHIGSTNLEFWTVHSGHNDFPSLRHLELHKCYKLQEIPFGLADVSSLQRMDLYHVTISAAASAMNIKAAKQEKAQQDPEQSTSQVTSAFKLFIFPSEDQ